MAQWKKVKWSRADQIVDPETLHETGLDAAAAPQDAYRTLREAGDLAAAAQLLAQALPRLEAVAWASRSVRDLVGHSAAGPSSAALRAALLWVQDPSEPRRRAAADAAELCPAAAPERMAALAAFYAGGSVAPPDCDAVPAPRDAAGRFAAGAILIASAAAPDMEAALSACLASGEALAVSGLLGEVAS